MRSVLMLAALTLVATPAAAETFGLHGITNPYGDPSGNAIAAGEAQLSVEITDAGDGLVLFNICNDGQYRMAVHNFMLDDRSGLLSFAEFHNSPPAVEFREGGMLDLPGGDAVDFQESFRSRAETIEGRVNTGEKLGALFQVNGGDFDDVLAALRDGALRVGLHVKEFEGGFRESFVTAVAMPEPGTMVLGGVSLAFGAFAARRRRRKAAESQED